ncbi:VCBS domain-containing protein [Tardiphaga sp.]|uniref:VCBS domain-containing protein n=1 Tax=Tardiphaga sp. TaxID=1926292 RepID=UPI0037DA77C3
MNYAGNFDFGLLGNSSSIDEGTGVVTTRVATDASAIVVDDAQLLFGGDYARRGSDLVLSKDGHDHVIADYFKSAQRKALSSSDGAMLSPDLVKALVGEVQVAQAGGAAAGAAQVIGSVSKLAGSATAIRNGVSVMLNVGDNVQKGDVVQAGADSSLNLTFIDGTVFGLSANARMVLNEMVYDPQGSANSSLLSLIQGTITFVAGETAKNGDMRVDTPVATMGIRGTAVLVEIGFEVPGQGSAPPVKFQVLVEPNGRTGSYVLYNKNTGAIMGTVNQAGQVTSITGGGDLSVGTAEPLSSIAQSIIQQTLQQYFPSYVPNANPRSGGGGGGSTPSDPNSGTNPDPLKFAPPPEPFPGQPFQVPINLPGSDINTPPVNVTITRFNTAPTVTVTPVVVVLPQDQNSFEIGKQVTITDPDAGDVATPYVPGSARIISATGPNGTPASLNLKSLVTVDPQTGHVTYDPAAFKFLGAGQKAVYVIEFDSQSGPDTTHQTLTFTVDGTNDAPVVTAALTGAVHQGDTAQVFDLVADASDPDLGDTATLSVTNIHYTLNGNQIPAAPNGVTLNGAQLHIDPAAFAYLGAGQIATLVIAYSVTDAHGASVTQTETITITGTNDAPAINTAQTTATAEAQNQGTAVTAQGTIAYTDADLTDTHDASVADDETAIGQLVLIPAPNGNAFNWSYSADPAEIAAALLASEDGVFSQTFLVTIADDHGGSVTQTVTVTITANVWTSGPTPPLTRTAVETDRPIGNNDWNNPDNWSQKQPPDATQFVLFQSDTYATVNLSDDVTIGSLLIDDCAWITLTSSGATHKLTVTDTFVNAGHIELAPGMSLQVSGYVQNSGTLVIDDVCTPAGAALVIDGTVTLGGGGTVTLDGFADRIVGAPTGDKNHAKLINLDNVIEGYGTLGDGRLDILNLKLGSIVADSYYKLTIDVRFADFINWGTIESNDCGGLEIKGDLVNYGELHAYSGLLKIDGDLTGWGSAKIQGGSLEFGGWSSANVTFSGVSHDTLILDRGSHFTGTVSGLSYGDSIDLKGIAPWQLWFGSHNGVVDVHYGRGADDYFTLTDPNVLKHLDISYDYRGGTELTWKNDAPEIDTSDVHLVKRGSSYTLSNLSVTDADSSRTEQYKLEITGKDSLTATLASIDDRLDGNFASVQGNGGQAMVTVKVTDSFGASDQVNFIFSTATTPKNVPLTLTGTDGKDLIFASNHDDTLKGFGGADQFIFQSGTGKDTIKDFQVGIDKIELDGIRGAPGLSGPLAELQFQLWKLSGGIEQHGYDTIIHLDGHNSVTLEGVKSWQLHASDFIVHNQPSMV